MSPNGGEGDGSCFEDFDQGGAGNLEVVGCLLGGQARAGGDDGNALVLVEGINDGGEGFIQCEGDDLFFSVRS